jgi:hypothetical protein
MIVMKKIIVIAMVLIDDRDRRGDTEDEENDVFMTYGIIVAAKGQR